MEEESSINAYAATRRRSSLPSLLSTAATTPAPYTLLSPSIEECWQHFNYADVYGDVTAAWAAYADADNANDAADDSTTTTTAAPERVQRKPTSQSKKCTLQELTDRLQREPMEDEIFEFVDVSAADCGPAPEQSSEVIGAQLIHEAGLVFSCSSLSPLTPGTCFNVTGHTTPNCERFSINLNIQHPRSGQRDIALHINPRLPQNYIVRNCMCNGTWGTEEVTSPLPFRLRRGHAFAVQVLCTETDFFIAVDGRHFAAFRHRLPYHKVTGLQVFGDVTHVQVDQLSVLQYPDNLCASNGNESSTSSTTVGRTNDAFWQPVENVSAAQVRQEHGRLMAMTRSSSSDMDMPFYGKLQSPLRVGQTLHIYGTVKMLPHSFYVNLQQGLHIWPHPTIAFHLNPRFASVGANNLIIRNSWHNGKWDREHRSQIATDFMPSRTFHMEIRCELEKFSVFVQGKCITEYVHRVEVCTVDTVHVQGDIRLLSVQLEV